MNNIQQRKKSILFYPCLIVFVMLASATISRAGDPPSPPSEKIVAITTDAKANPDYLLGERLFYGLAPYESGIFNCEACHYTINSDTLNWNPSACDLAVWMKDKGVTDIKKVLDAPVSQKMEDAHKKMALTKKEISKIKVYLEYVRMQGLIQPKPFPARGIIFFFFGFLMAAALIDLIFTRFIRYRIIHALVLAAGLSVHFQMVMAESQALSRTKDYAPDQPIKFSHKVHAGDNRIDCKYCHFNAASGKSAGLPSLNTCTNCHNVVMSGRNSGKFEISKISEALKNNKPVAWVRIHTLPDFVYFNHAQHVTAGKTDCNTCHGPVPTMDIMKQFSDLSMGWCVNCHRNTNVQVGSNPYYSSNKKFMETMRKKNRDIPNVENIGGLDCMQCHY